MKQAGQENKTWVFIWQKDCWGWWLFYWRPRVKELLDLTPSCLLLSPGFVFGSLQEIVPIGKSPQFKKGNSDHPCLTMLFHCTLAILLLWQFSWLWKATLSSNIFSAWENATCQFCSPPAGLISPCLPESTVVWELPDLKRREKHLALALTSAPPFPDELVCERDLLLLSDVQHIRDHKTQKTKW